MNISYWLKNGIQNINIVAQKHELVLTKVIDFDAKKAGPSFLTPKASAAFNHLWLAFIKASILWHFDLEYHIRIKTDASDYAISSV